MPFRANPAAFRRLANRRFDRAGGRGGLRHPRLPGELLRSLHDREHPFLGLAYLTHSERVAIPKPLTTTPSCPKTWRRAASAWLLRDENGPHDRHRRASRRLLRIL